jgi:hypothetical protein
LRGAAALVYRGRGWCARRQAITLNLRIRDDASRFFRLHGHVCEVQLLLRAVAELQVPRFAPAAGLPDAGYLVPRFARSVRGPAAAAELQAPRFYYSQA